jgi:hypothetical protein
MILMIGAPFRISRTAGEFQEPIGNAFPHFGGNHDIGSQAGHLTATSRNRHIRSGHLHTRTDHSAIVDGVPECHVNEGPKGSYIPDRGEACEKRRAGLSHPDEGILSR